MVVITIVSLAVGAVAAAVQSDLESDVVLAALIAAATVAYAGFTWRLVRSAERDREERRRIERRADRNLLEALVVEMKQNKARRGQTHAWYTYVPFERSALDTARALRASLPKELAEALHEVETRIARFNAVARYNEVQVRMGSGAADAELTRLAGEVDDSLEVALDQLCDYVASLTP